MRLMSWNVNGIRSALRKGALRVVNDFDIVLLQEIRSSDLPLDLLSMDFNVYGFPAVRKGYSGVLTLSRVKPINVIRGIGVKDFDDEGRVISIELPDFYVINVYFPRAGDNLSRLSFKLAFNRSIEKFALDLRLRKPVVICGDFNAVYARQDSSFWNENHPGLTPLERQWLSEFIGKGFTDTFRLIHPNEVKYSWRSYRDKSKAMRIDYCLASSELTNRVVDADILNNVEGSDHSPVLLVINP
ncbi:exodeoxyribonuclease III [Caldivirga sp. UBA161]|uniref:exodeoxyribonuclease III n=1 Tax=Caldivirga sp. UBA161 TaxID=1915569 RepID=UPI0025C496D4|nr:exodeoxyribonuclease III [Caldivirga sp. UBA161]